MLTAKQQECIVAGTPPVTLRGRLERDIAASLDGKGPAFGPAYHRENKRLYSEETLEQKAVDAAARSQGDGHDGGPQPVV
eukprot:3257733-Lingulodinium_polyedra.AAC.1